MAANDIHLDMKSTTRGQEWKVDTLCDLYETLTITQAIIYCALAAGGFLGELLLLSQS